MYLHSMVDTEGPVEIASSRGDRGGRQEVDLIMERDEEVQCEGDCTAGDKVVWECGVSSGKECCVNIWKGEACEWR